MDNHVIKVFNRERKIKQLNRAAKNFENSDFLYNESANRLATQFNEIIKKRFDVALNIGSKNGYLSDLIVEKSVAKKVMETDIASNFLKIPKNNNYKILIDEELLPFKDASFDLIISNLALHWVNDLPGTLVQIRRILKKGGFFCATLFGGKTLQELRSSMISTGQAISPRISPFIDVKDGATLLQRTKFEEPVSVSEDIIVKYSSIYELLKDLRNMGETNSLEKLNSKYPGKNYFNEVEKSYRQNFSDTDNNIDASFEIITISGWKK